MIPVGSLEVDVWEQEFKEAMNGCLIDNTGEEE